jgi:hypothetical protein
LFGDSGLPQAFDNGLKLGQIRRVVAHRRPDGAEAGDGEGRVESEAGLNCGTGLIEAAKDSELYLPAFAAALPPSSSLGLAE